MKHVHRYMAGLGGRLGTPTWYGFDGESSPGQGDGNYGSWAVGNDSIALGAINSSGGVTADPTGTKVLTCQTNNTLRQYNLTTAWDINTGVIWRTTSDIGANLYGIHYWSDGVILANTASGTKAYGCNDYDIATLPSTLSTRTGGPFSVGVFGRPGGGSWYIGDSSNSIRQYTAANAYLPSAGATLVVDKSVVTPGNFVTGINISPDGRWLIYTGQSGNFTITLYELTTPWALSTATYKTKWDVPDNGIGSSSGMHYDFIARKGFVTSTGASRLYNLTYTPA